MWFLHQILYGVFGLIDETFYYLKYFVGFLQLLLADQACEKQTKKHRKIILIASQFIFEMVFCTIFTYHNVGVLSADFKVNEDTSLKFCQAKIVQNNVLKMNGP